MGKFANGGLPKPMKDMLAALGKEGASVTAEDISGLPQKQRAAVFSSLNTTLRTHFPDKFDEYIELEWDEKREWLASFVVDPKSGGSVVRNTTSRTITKNDNRREVWLTQSQLGGPEYLNDPELAKIAIESCESRPHSTNKALRDAKVLEYQWFVDKKDVNKRLQEKAELNTEAVLEEGDVEGVKSTLEIWDATKPLPGTKRPAKRARKESPGKPLAPRADKENTTPPELTEEEKLQIAAQEDLDAKLKSTKIFYDKMKRELSSIKATEETLKRKPWLADGLSFLREATEQQQKQAEELHDVWTRIKASEFVDAAAKTKATGELIQAKDNTDSLYTKFRKEVLADFLRLK